MKQLKRALFLLTGLTLLAGCDAFGAIPLGVNHRPEVTLATITGFVEDSAGNPLEGAMVSNGASVTFTDANGAFTLTKVRTGIQYITASYDNVKSTPVEIEVRSGSNSLNKIVVPTVGRVSDFQNPVKFVGLFPDTLTASYSIVTPEASPDVAPEATPSYTAAIYPDGRDIQIALASPPNGSGVLIRSYRVTYSAAEIATLSADFSPAIRVEPGSLTESGPNKTFAVKNIAPITEAFSEALHKSDSGMIEATVTLYTEDKDNQSPDKSVTMHSPESGNPDKAIPFRARIYIQRASN